MDLTLSDEQRLLRKSAERFVTDNFTAEHRLRMANDPLGFSPALWSKFWSLGLVSMTSPSRAGSEAVAAITMRT